MLCDLLDGQMSLIGCTQCAQGRRHSTPDASWAERTPKTVRLSPLTTEHLGFGNHEMIDFDAGEASFGRTLSPRRFVLTCRTDEKTRAVTTYKVSFSRANVIQQSSKFTKLPAVCKPLHALFIHRAAEFARTMSNQWTLTHYPAAALA